MARSSGSRIKSDPAARLEAIRDQLCAASLSFVMRRVFDILSLRPEDRADGYDRMEAILRAVANRLPFDDRRDLELWIEATMSGIRIEVLRIEQSGGSTAGHA